jgi:hypothetical protein
MTKAKLLHVINQLEELAEIKTCAQCEHRVGGEPLGGGLFANVICLEAGQVIPAHVFMNGCEAFSRRIPF